MAWCSFRSGLMGLGAGGRGGWRRPLPRRSLLGAAGGPGLGRLGGSAGCGRAVAGVAGGGAGLPVEAALVVTFEAELLFGVLGAGAQGVGEGLDGVQLGGAGCGLGVTFAGGIGADVVVFGAGVGFGLPGAADLGLGVVAGLTGGGQRGVPLGTGGVSLLAGLSGGGVGLAADLGDAGLCLVADGLRAGVGGVGGL